MIYGQERVGGEWWRLWCSKECARQHVPGLADVESFASKRSFGDHLGWDAAELARHRFTCGDCGASLEDDFIVFDTYADRYVAGIDQYDGEISDTPDPRHAAIYHDAVWRGFWAGFDDGMRFRFEPVPQI